MVTDIDFNYDDSDSDLSPGARKLAKYAREKRGNIADILKAEPDLIDALDEFLKWKDGRINDLHQVSGKNATAGTVHPFRGL